MAKKRISPAPLRPQSEKKLIHLRLPVDLVAAIEAMGQGSMAGGIIPAPRKLHGMLECCLLYAVWKHSHGSGPDAEMSTGRGYPKWDEKLRECGERDEVEELERLYSLGSLDNEQPCV